MGNNVFSVLVKTTRTYSFCLPLQTELLVPFHVTQLCPSSNGHPQHHEYLQMYDMLRHDFSFTKLGQDQKLDGAGIADMRLTIMTLALTV